MKTATVHEPIKLTDKEVKAFLTFVKDFFIENSGEIFLPGFEGFYNPISFEPLQAYENVKPKSRL